jgi:hypothetical protein
MRRRAEPALAVAVLGVSTPFAYWGFHLVRAIVEAVAGPTLALHTTGLAELRAGSARRDGGNVVMSSDLPDAELARFVSGADLPVIVFSDDAGLMFDWTMQSRGLGAQDAARLCSRVCSSLSPALEARRRLVVAPLAAPAEVVSAILAFLWPRRSGGLESLAFEPPAPCGPVACGLLRTEMTAALAAYADLTLGRKPDEIVWPLSLFTRGDGRSWRAPFDLAGPARALLYGPYMHLPVGDWTARVEFEIAGALSGVEATTDVRTHEVVTQKAFALPAKGVFAYDLSFAVRDPHHPVEIRLFLRKAAIEGVFLARSVKLRPQRRAAAL